MIPYREAYFTGRHRYTHEELQDNLRAYGLTVVGEGLSAQLDGPEDLLRETRAQINAGIFLGDWDGPSETGEPNWLAATEEALAIASAHLRDAERLESRVAEIERNSESYAASQEATRLLRYDAREPRYQAEAWERVASRPEGTAYIETLAALEARVKFYEERVKS